MDSEALILGVGVLPRALSVGLRALGWSCLPGIPADSVAAVGAAVIVGGRGDGHDEAIRDLTARHIPVVAVGSLRQPLPLIAAVHGGAAATQLDPKTDTGTITVLIGQDARSGRFTVLVGLPSEAAESTETFTVEATPRQPEIAVITPLKGIPGQTPVTIDGLDLPQAGVQSVLLNTTPVMGFRQTGNQVIFTLPWNAKPGQVRVGLRLKDGVAIYGGRPFIIEGVGLRADRPLGAVSPASLIAAWTDLAPWVQGKLPELAQSSTLPGESQDAGNIGACEGLNQPGSHSTARWGSDGDATITLSALKISAMSGVAISPALAADGITVHLPLSFGELKVEGSYSYGQPCALYDAGKKTDTATAAGTGSITQTIENGSLYYVASLGSTVTLSAVVVNGSPTVSVSPDGGGDLPSWLEKLTSFFHAFDEAAILRSSLQNVFLTADFSKQMLDLLNGKVGG